MKTRPHDGTPAAGRARLKALLRKGHLVTAPGIFDMISMRIADRMGFEALYMTGYGTVASHLGLPDAGLASYTDMVNRVQAFCGMATTPVICDADTGYGGLLNVAHTVHGYEAAGAAAIQLEDQEYPKKCGHTPNRRVIPMADMVAKIRVAIESRESPDFLVVARTDARTSLGLDEALRRGEAYARAGADVLFVESPETEDELATIGRSFDLPLLVNVVESGRTPILAPEVLEQMGFSIAIYPALGFLSMGKAVEDAYGHLKTQRTSIGHAGHLYDFNRFNSLMNFESVWAFDAAHADPKA